MRRHVIATRYRESFAYSYACSYSRNCRDNEGAQSVERTQRPRPSGRGQQARRQHPSDPRRKRKQRPESHAQLRQPRAQEQEKLAAPKASKDPSGQAERQQRPDARHGEPDPTSRCWNASRHAPL